MASNMTPNSSTGDVSSSPDAMEIVPHTNPPSTSKAGNDTQSGSSKKTAGRNLSEFVLALDEYVPTLPDPVVSFYLQAAGFETSDPRIVRLISVAAQKFLSDIANDALQHCKMRGGPGQTKKSNKDKRFVLTMEDLAPALDEQGISVKKPHYFS